MATGGESQEKRPRIILKSIRKRAGARAEDCAKALGHAGATGYLRYENEKLYDTKRIPYRVIQAIAPLVVGKGIPSVSIDDLINISEVTQLGSVLNRMRLSSPSAGTGPTGDADAPVRTPAIALEVRYRAELGALYDPKRVGARRNYRRAPLTPMRNYPAESQWAMRIEDDHAEPMGIFPGSYMHCVDVVAAPPTWRVHNRPFPLQRTDRNGYAENIIGTVVKFLTTDGSRVLARLPGDNTSEPFEASVIGVPIAVMVWLINNADGESGDRA